jgi:DNA (cytosine-5)-methyltransferase 1
MKHLDLFSGIGGFSLAADLVWGKENVEHIFCEIEEFPQKVLKKHWPGSRIHRDIKTFPKYAHECIECEDCGEPFCEECNAHYADCDCIGPDELGDFLYEDNEIFIVTGGFPCQPFSNLGSVHGGKLGENDNRALWPEMFRIIRDYKPDWVIGENVVDFINMGLDQAITDMEGIGYDCQPLVIPACGLGFGHRRERLWIVANLNSVNMQGWDGEAKKEWKIEERRIETLVDIENGEYIPKPEFCGKDDGIPSRVDRLKGLGNAIVPQVAAVIMQAIKDIETP